MTPSDCNYQYSVRVGFLTRIFQSHTGGWGVNCSSCRTLVIKLRPGEKVPLTQNVYRFSCTDCAVVYNQTRKCSRDRLTSQTQELNAILPIPSSLTNWRDRYSNLYKIMSLNSVYSYFSWSLSLRVLSVWDFGEYIKSIKITFCYRFQIPGFKLLRLPSHLCRPQAFAAPLPVRSLMN